MKRQTVKWKPPSSEKEYELFYYTVSLTDDGKLIVNQVPERPNVSEVLDSILIVDRADFALNITWLAGKPAPESVARHNGIVAVMQDLADISGHPEILDMFGIGHLHGAKADIHEKGGR